MRLKYKKIIKKRLNLMIPFFILVLIISIFTIGKLIQIKNYKVAVNLMNKGEYKSASQAFKTMGKYKDCLQLQLKCDLMPYYESAVTLMEEGKYKSAQKKFDVLENFIDSREKSVYCMNSSAYQYAISLMEKGNYFAAASAFRKLKSFKDAKKLATECEHLKTYNKANELYVARDYMKARKTFEGLGDFKDAKQMVTKCLDNAYQIAKKLMGKNKYVSAKLMYAELGDYKDSRDLCVQCENLELRMEYNKGVTAFKEKKFYTASKIFQGMNGYLDSKDKANECLRQYPKTQVLYRNKKFSFNFAPIIIHTGIKEPTYLKIYTKKEMLIATAFINTGETIRFKMPSGNYIIKEANGTKWYGEKEMFGEEGEYYILNTDLVFKNWGAGYEITLNNEAGGNLESHLSLRKNF